MHRLRRYSTLAGLAVLLACLLGRALGFVPVVGPVQVSEGPLLLIARPNVNENGLQVGGADHVWLIDPSVGLDGHELMWRYNLTAVQRLDRDHIVFADNRQRHLHNLVVLDLPQARSRPLLAKADASFIYHGGMGARMVWQKLDPQADPYFDRSSDGSIIEPRHMYGPLYQLLWKGHSYTESVIEPDHVYVLGVDTHQTVYYFKQRQDDPTAQELWRLGHSHDPEHLLDLPIEGNDAFVLSAGTMVVSPDRSHIAIGLPHVRSSGFPWRTHDLLVLDLNSLHLRLHRHGIFTWLGPQASLSAYSELMMTWSNDRVLRYSASHQSDECDDIGEAPSHFLDVTLDILTGENIGGTTNHRAMKGAHNEPLRRKDDLHDHGAFQIYGDGRVFLNGQLIPGTELVYTDHHVAVEPHFARMLAFESASDDDDIRQVYVVDATDGVPRPVLTDLPSVPAHRLYWLPGTDGIAAVDVDDDAIDEAAWPSDEA